jgi:DNA-directed RNA polymerase specialized sigma24 family protein
MSIFLKNIDSSELESRFSNDNKLQYIDSGFPYTFKDLEPYLELLPKKEYDLIIMYYVLKKEQKEIAQILRLTQGGVSHRISRAKARLRFLVKVPKFTEEELFQDLKDLFDELDLTILWGLYETTCQSEVAKRVGMTQSRIRHRFMKNLEALEKVQYAEAYRKYYEAFYLISDNNFNILREIKLPKWASKALDYIDDEQK